MTAVLLALGVAAELLCCVGLLLMRSAIDRLHYTAAAATVGPLLIAAAIVVDESLSPASITTVLTALLLIGLNAALTVAIARLARGLEP